MDLFRYAESRGHEFDANTPNAYRYRDYLIRALNADVPYDQFVSEHMAGDLLEKPRLHPETGANESILATGFWFLGEWIHSPVDTRQDEADRFDNMIGVFSKSFLGLTVACARCHDHKFDPISTQEYYGLAGIFTSTQSVVHGNVGQPMTVSLHSGKAVPSIARQDCRAERQAGRCNHHHDL